VILYDYFRSSASYRVRIALNLKGVSYQAQPINLLQGEEREASYLSVNPQGVVPTLELDDGSKLYQSLAICEYLEECHPEPPLLPDDAAGRARVRALAQVVACEIHPLNNLGVLQYLTGTLNVGEEAKLSWYRHWIAKGLSAIEAQLNHPQTGRFCHGDTPTLADVYLVPQLFNARRFECDLAAFLNILRVSEACETLAAFQRAHPSQQPDAR